MIKINLPDAVTLGKLSTLLNVSKEQVVSNAIKFYNKERIVMEKLYNGWTMDTCDNLLLDPEGRCLGDHMAYIRIQQLEQQLLSLGHEPDGKIVNNGV